MGFMTNLFLLFGVLLISNLANAEADVPTIEEEENVIVLTKVNLKTCELI
jgi:hypothetical protein